VPYDTFPIGARFVTHAGRIFCILRVEEKSVYTTDGQTFLKSYVEGCRFLPPVPAWLRPGERVLYAGGERVVSAVLGSEVVLSRSFDPKVFQPRDDVRLSLGQAELECEAFWSEGTHICTVEGHRYVKAWRGSYLVWYPTGDSSGPAPLAPWIREDPPEGSARIPLRGVSPSEWVQAGAILRSKEDFFDVSSVTPSLFVVSIGRFDPKADAPSPIRWYVPFDLLKGFAIVSSPGLRLSRYRRELFL
jgi:hypothetical protein